MLRRPSAIVPAPFLALAALALASGCSVPKETRVDGAWVRLPAVAHQPGAAYFTLHAGPVDEKLIDVSSDVAIRSEMHETMRAGTAAAMKTIASVTIPAKGVARFQPGGRHVMLFDINPAVKPGGTMTLTFTFADGLRVQQTAAVVGAGDPPPKGA